MSFNESERQSAKSALKLTPKQLTRVLVKSNDIFDELFDENKRLLNELLFANNCLMKLKTQLSHIYHTFETQLTAEDKHNYNELTQELRPLDAGVKQEDTADTRVHGLYHSLQWTTPADLLIASLTTDEGIDATPVPPKKTPTKRPKKTCDTNKTSDNAVVVKQRRRRSPKTPVIECSAEELEEMRQKYVDRKDIWDAETQRFLCPKSDCPVSSKSIKNLYNHLRTSHKMPSIGISCQDRVNEHTAPYLSPDGQHYVCVEPNCLQPNGLFDNQLNFYRHLIKDHRKLPDIVCEYCGKVFKKSKLYTLHKRIHTNTKPYACHMPGCEYRGRTKPQLNYHMAVHTEDRPFLCAHEGCAKSFKSREKLREHSETHDPHFRIKCSADGCDEWFKSRYWRTIHVKLVHKGLPPELCKKVAKKFVCDWPGCEFRGALQNLAIHKSVHTGERPFACDWPNCGKRFRLKQYLNDHKNIHINQKPLVCHWPGCAYRCNDSGNLRKHIRTTHK